MFRIIKNDLMNSVAWGPRDDMGGGGWDNQEGGDPLDGNEGEDGQDDDSDSQDEITLDGNVDILDDLYKPIEGKEEAEGNDDSDAVTFPSQDEVTADLKKVLEDYDVPEDMIPEDMDFSDRRQMRTLMTNVGRHAVTSALAAMFKPINIAMNQQSHELRREMRSSVQSSLSQDKEMAILSQVIPAYQDKTMRGQIDVLYAKAKERHPKDPKLAATMTRDAMKALGMNPNGRKQSQGRSQGGGLDSYTGRLPNLNPAPKPGQRNADRLKR